MLAFAWYPHGWLPLLFIAFIPLMAVEYIVFHNPDKYKSRTVYFAAFISFFIWNLLTTWWLVNASWGGAVIAVGLNSVFMAFVFLFFHKIKKRVGEKWGYLVFISLWIGFEFLYHGDQISWPWLTLGNAFADTTTIVQWYEFTGVFGGSLWVLVINCIFFSCLTDSFTKKKFMSTIAIILFPIGISFLLLIFSNETCKPITYKVVIVQPNIDPYNEKFTGTYTEQLQKMLVLAAEKIDSTTDYVVLPETALIEDIWEDELEQTSSIISIRKFLLNFPKLKMIVGASTAKAFRPGEELSETARKFYNADAYYDAYNTAFQIDNSNTIQKYHKSKLVPGVEQMPLQFIFKYFEQFALEMGGTSGSLGFQSTRTVFKSGDGEIKFAPVICYESVYGEYVSDYVKNGANVISVITNDGWWGNTPGHIQHLKLSKLRAIENRRWVVRSANTGISCFISPQGEVSQATEYWVPASIAGKIELNNSLTFYTRFGDYIGRIAMYMAFLLIAYSWLIRFRIIKKA